MREMNSASRGRKNEAFMDEYESVCLVVRRMQKGEGGSIIYIFGWIPRKEKR